MGDCGAQSRPPTRRPRAPRPPSARRDGARDRRPHLRGRLGRDEGPHDLLGFAVRASPPASRRGRAEIGAGTLSFTRSSSPTTRHFAERTPELYAATLAQPPVDALRELGCVVRAIGLVELQEHGEPLAQERLGRARRGAALGCGAGRKRVRPGEHAGVERRGDERERVFVRAFPARDQCLRVRRTIGASSETGVFLDVSHRFSVGQRGRGCYTRDPAELRLGRGGMCAS